MFYGRCVLCPCNLNCEYKKITVLAIIVIPNSLLKLYLLLIITHHTLLQYVYYIPSILQSMAINIIHFD